MLTLRLFVTLAVMGVVVVCGTLPPDTRPNKGKGPCKNGPVECRHLCAKEEGAGGHCNPAGECICSGSYKKTTKAKGTTSNSRAPTSRSATPAGKPTATTPSGGVKSTSSVPPSSEADTGDSPSTQDVTAETSTSSGSGSGASAPDDGAESPNTDAADGGGGSNPAAAVDSS